MTDQEEPTCTRCGRDLDDPQAAVCSECTSRLTTRLTTVARLAGEATTTITRQSHITIDTTGRPDLEPWEKHTYALRPTTAPVSLTAAADHDAAVTVLTTWARHIHEESGRPLPTVWTAPCPHTSCDERRHGLITGPVCPQHRPAPHPLTVVALWLTEQLRWLRYRKEADQAYDELDDACRLIERVVDRPAVRWSAGDCWFCREPLNPAAGAFRVTCPGCGATYTTAEIKARLLAQAEDALAGASWCAATLTRLGVPCTAAAVRKWAERGRLTPVDTDTAGRPRYRLGDVRRLAQDAIIRSLHRQHEGEQKARDTTGAVAA